MDLKKTLNEAIDETLEEAYDGAAWNNARYTAYSEPPRKDYMPISTSDGYSFPYQRGAPPISPPIGPQPENTPEIPWPLQTVTDDFADSFVYLVSALKKMETCLRTNPVLKKHQRHTLKKYIKYVKGALARIQVVGSQIIHDMNLAGELPSQVPTGAPEDLKVKSSRVPKEIKDK